MDLQCLSFHETRVDICHRFQPLLHRAQSFAARGQTSGRIFLACRSASPTRTRRCVPSLRRASILGCACGLKFADICSLLFCSQGTLSNCDQDYVLIGAISQTLQVFINSLFKSPHFVCVRRDIAIARLFSTVIPWQLCTPTMLLFPA